MITITPNNMNVPPPNMMNQMRYPPPSMNPNLRVPPPPRQQFFQPFRAYRQGGNGPVIFDPEFDGKKLRKSAMRKTVDYNTAIIKMLESRVWQRDFRDRHGLLPDAMYTPDLLPPSAYEENPINAVTTRFVKTATNKMRCPIFCMAWTPEGRRLVTGASSGEFTLWNGLTFNFETILQAHDTPVRTMVWSHNELWMVTADHSGYVKYWQSNMNNVKMFLAHQEPIRGISFSPSDSKFASCSDDGTVKIWDFYRCIEERTLRGHGADVKCVHWHPYKGLVISGSKDNQQPVKLWDPKTGNPLATIHAHKSTVMDIKWNNNGNWFVTASRDHLLKLYDIRNLTSEVQVFRGHKKESSSVAWHPIHEGLFCSGGSDGAILFWHVGADKEVGVIEQAHDSIVWTLAWHPMGHILCSGSNDHTSKFWTRNRPGDLMKDKYNLNTLPAGADGSVETECGEEMISSIPGMGPEDKVEIDLTGDKSLTGLASGTIPGLEDLSDIMSEDKSKAQVKKVPYSKPIPKNFQAQWNDSVIDSDDEDSKDVIDPVALLNQLLEHQPGVKPIAEIEPEALYIYGKVLTVERGSSLATAISEGSDKLLRYIHTGAIRELEDVIPHYETEDGQNMPFILHDENEPVAHSLDGSGLFPTLGQLFPGQDFEEYVSPVATTSVTTSYQVEGEDFPGDEEEYKVFDRPFSRDLDEVSEEGSRGGFSRSEYSRDSGNEGGSFRQANTRKSEKFQQDNDFRSDDNVSFRSDSSVRNENFRNDDFRKEGGNFRNNFRDNRFNRQDNGFRGRNDFKNSPRDDDFMDEDSFQRSEDSYREESGSFQDNRDFQEDMDYRDERGGGSGYRREGSNFRDEGNNFRGGDGNFRGGNGNFRGGDRNFRGGDGNFRGGDGNFRGRDGNFRGNDGNFRGNDGNFRGGEGNFRGGDGSNFREENDMGFRGHSFRGGNNDSGNRFSGGNQRWNAGDQEDHWMEDDNNQNWSGPSGGGEDRDSSRGFKSNKFRSRGSGPPRGRGGGGRGGRGNRWRGMGGRRGPRK